MAKSQSAEPVKRQPAPGRARGGRRAPLLLETAYAITFGLTLVAGLATAALSALAGAPAWLIAVRAGLAVLVLGLVFWLVNYQLMHGAFEAAGRPAGGLHSGMESLSNRSCSARPPRPP